MNVRDLVRFHKSRVRVQELAGSYGTPDCENEAIGAIAVLVEQLADKAWPPYLEPPSPAEPAPAPPADPPSEGDSEPEPVAAPVAAPKKRGRPKNRK